MLPVLHCSFPLGVCSDLLLKCVLLALFFIIIVNNLTKVEECVLSGREIPDGDNCEVPVGRQLGS